MMFNFLLVLVLISTLSITCQEYLQPNHALNSVLEQTENLFGKLKVDYAIASVNKNVMFEINNTINEHIKNTSKAIFARHKRELSEDSNKDINILDGFQNSSELNFNDIRDVNFFSLENELQTIWFAAILDVSKISLFQINNHEFHFIKDYSLTNSTRITVNSCAYGVLLIVQDQSGSIHILRFTKVKDNYFLHLLQDFELNDVTHLTVWQGMNQLYLGVASYSNISIFTWLGDYFDSVQVINLGTKKLVPFYSKEFMYLAVTGPTTFIYKYFLKSNQFTLTQRLPSSQDMSFFQLREGHFMEHFLCLSTESFVIVYKEIHDRFIPFQQISPGTSTVPIISNNAILILSLYKDTVIAYQYNGWRFAELSIKLFGIEQFRQVMLHEKELLLLKYKNNTWMLKQPTWSRKKSYKHLQAEIKTWTINAKDAAKRTVVEIPERRNSIKILRGNIDQLFVYNINEHNLQTLRNVSEDFKNVVSKLQKQKVIMNNKLYSENLTFTSLPAKKTQLKCKTKCKHTPLTVKEIMKRKCPLLNLPIENIIINKTINGISLVDLQKNLLKVTGNQEVSGIHSFLNMNVTNAFISLNIASNLSKQEIQAKEIKVKQLNLTEEGFLLPLNGPMVTMTGLIKASKVKADGNIELQAKITGDGIKHLLPIVPIQESMILDNNVTLENVTIENLRSTDLIANDTESIKDILSNAIPLYNNVSIPLIFSSESTKWSNITLYGPQKWITAKSQDIVAVPGRKHILHNVKITVCSHENLKFPRIETPLCGATVIAREIKISMVKINNIDVKRLKSLHIFGNLGEKYVNYNSTSFFKSLDLSSQQLHQNITVKNISAIHLNGIDLTELKKYTNSWIEPNIFETPIEATNLSVKILQSPVQCRLNFLRVIKNIISEENTYVGTINNINFVGLLANTIKLGDMISLKDITFGNGIAVNHTYASHFPLILTPLEENLNLHKKYLSGNIETNSVNLPYTFGFLGDETPFNIILQGSVVFPTEPTLQNVNKISLQELLTKVWMVTNTAPFGGKYLYMTNVLIKGDVTLNSYLSTLHSESWKNISKRILSKTRSQEIQTIASMNNVKTSAITGSNISNIECLVSDFNDMFNNALIRDKEQKVNAKWTFDKLQVLEKVHRNRKVNGMNLKTDVMRYDVEGNIVTGKKTIAILTTENLNGLNFHKWIGDAVMHKNKLIIIKGQKSFNTVTFKNMNVSGTVSGRNIQEALSKSANQTIFEQKTFRGSVNASALVVDGFVNDVNLTDLMYHQLKKQKPSQRLKARITLQNDLRIVGNLTINGSYGTTELKNFYKNYSNVTPVAEKIKKISTAAGTINIALRNRAIYIDKLEVVKEIVAINASDNNTTLYEKRCKVKSSPQIIANEEVINILLKPNQTDFVLIKSISLGEDEFVVWIKFNSISIYVYNDMEENLSHLKEFYIPRIIDAFVEAMSHSLWIVLRLISQTLVLHYQPWQDLQEYILPATDVFTISRSPNNQFLLLLTNGVWNLEGLASPQHFLEIPLKDKVETFIGGSDYYINHTSKNIKTLLKARYVGN